MSMSGSCCLALRAGLSFPAPKDDEESTERNDGQHATQPHDSHDGDGVTLAGLVMVTEKQDLIPGAAELAFGGLDQGKAQVLGRKLDAGHGARELALGGEQEHAG